VHRRRTCGVDVDININICSDRDDDIRRADHDHKQSSVDNYDQSAAHCR
jgi:hypothetical protein